MIAEAAKIVIVIMICCVTEPGMAAEPVGKKKKKKGRKGRNGGKN